MINILYFFHIWRSWAEQINIATPYIAPDGWYQRMSIVSSKMLSIYLRLWFYFLILSFVKLISMVNGWIFKSFLRYC